MHNFKKDVASLICLLILFLINFQSGYGQQPGSVDFLFGSPSLSGDSISRFSDVVNSILIQQDGKLIIAGNFITYNGIAQNRIIRMNAIGNIDTNFNGVTTGFDNEVNSLAIQSNNKILVGGEFSTYNSVAATKLVRLNTNGTRDSSFLYNNSQFGGVLTIAIQTDDKIIIGGGFNSDIMRLNQNGLIDSTFNIGTGFDDGVTAIKIQPNGKIVVAGYFTSYNGITCNRITRLNTDGSIDSTFITAGGFDGHVNTLSLTTSGKIIAGGSFSYYGGIYSHKIVQINSNGTPDNSFITGDGFNIDVMSSFIQPDGKILLGGYFTSFDSVPVNRFIRLDSIGNRDNSFYTGTGIDDEVQVIVIDPASNIYVGGKFLNIQNTDRNRIACLEANGWLKYTFKISQGFDMEVLKVVVQPDGKILVGGNFNKYNGYLSRGIIRLDQWGNIDTSFHSGFIFSSTVLDIQIDTINHKIYLGGIFQNYLGLTYGNIICLNMDGSLDGFFNSSPGFDDYVYTIQILPERKILVGGKFFSYDNQARLKITLLDSTGHLDPSFNGYFDDDVFKIKAYEGNKIIVAGAFSNYIAASNKRIVRLNSDFSVDTTFVTGTGLNGYSCNDFAIQPDGKILFAGGFSDYNGYSIGNIVRVQPNGIIDSTFDPGVPSNAGISEIAIQPSGKITLIGSFTIFNSHLSNKIIQILPDGSVDSTFNVGSGFSGYPSCLALQEDNKLLVGGLFNKYDNYFTNCLVRLNGASVVSVNEIESADKLTVFPNPAKDYIKINSFENFKNSILYIYNSFGQQMRMEKFSGNIININYPEGIYILKIVNDKKTITGKFLIQ